MDDTLGWIQLALYIGALLIITKPLGLYLLQVLDAKGRTWLDPVCRPVERFTYRIAGIDPEKELEVSVDGRYLTIHAVRSSKVESRHRSEFRYGSFGRTLELPPGADAEDVTADYADGILTVKVALKGQRQAPTKRIEVSGKK